MTDTIEKPASEASDADSGADGQCTAWSDAYDRRCQNPAILGRDLCHTHIDFTEYNTDDPADGEAAPYRQYTAPTPTLSNMKNTDSDVKTAENSDRLKTTPGGVDR